MPVDEREVVLGVDLGTSGVGVVAMAADGAVVARSDRALELRTPRPGWTEQEPAAWVAAAEGAVREVVERLGSTRVRAIALAGQMHGMVALDGHGEVVHPAILWNDGRTEVETRELEERIGRDRLVARTGNRAVPGFQLPKVLWLRRHAPDAFARVRCVLFPKDYLGLHLTGRAVAEPTDASGSGAYDLGRGAWDAEVLAELDLDAGLWPELLPSTAVVGGLRREVADALGLPDDTVVVAGAADNAAAATALGLTHEVPGLGSVSLGTSGVVQVTLARPTPDPGGRVHLFAHTDGGYLALGVTLAAAGSLRWYRDTLAPGRSYESLLAAAAASPAGARGVTFVPYLAGERTPHMRTDLRGSLHGLSLATGEGDLVRAVLEGVACSLRDARDVIDDLAPTDRLLATGGGASSDLWLQTLADALETPVVRALDAAGEPLEVGAAEGAAVLGWRALGTDVTLQPHDTVVFEPSDEGRAAQGAVRTRYRRYSRLGVAPG